MNAPQTATQPSGATQSIDWHKATSRMQRPKAVEFAAGNDAAQMLGAWICWQRWCWETHGRDIDHATWLEQFVAKRNSGCWLQLIGWDGGEPVAMVEIGLVYDVMLREQVCHGDKAWIHPDYRSTGIFKQILDYLVDLTLVLGVTHGVVPVTAGDDASAPWLRRLYEKHGFKLTGLYMACNPIRRAA